MNDINNINKFKKYITILLKTLSEIINDDKIKAYSNLVIQGVDANTIDIMKIFYQYFGKYKKVIEDKDENFMNEDNLKRIIINEGGTNNIINNIVYIFGYWDKLNKDTQIGIFKYLQKMIECCENY